MQYNPDKKNVYGIEMQTWTKGVDDATAEDDFKQMMVLPATKTKTTTATKTKPTTTAKGDEDEVAPEELLLEMMATPPRKRKAKAPTPSPDASSVAPTSRGLSSSPEESDYEDDSAPTNSYLPVPKDTGRKSSTSDHSKPRIPKREPTKPAETSAEDQDLQNGGPVGGDHDQTGDEHAVYQSANISLKKGSKSVHVTVDRSGARAGKPQPHKLWVFSRTGWRKYEHAQDLGEKWEDKKKVDQLNKWRDQHYRRLGLELKRTEHRETYTNGELDCLFAFIKPAGGAKPVEGMAEVQKRFNQKFGADRRLKAIESVVQRLREEYRNNGGERRVRLGRGHNMSKA